MYQMILRGARLGDGVVDVGIEDGRIGRVARRIEDRATREIEAHGRLISPPFIESHVHLDTTLTAGDPRWNASGTLFEGIQIWSQRKRDLTHDDVIHRATELLRWQADQGVLHVRTHADVTDPEFTGLRALLEVKEKVRGWMGVQIVAFPQEGMLSYPRGVELMEEALRLGADLVGGIPHYEHTREMGVESVKESFRPVEKHDKPIDIHCDETDDPHSRFLEVMAAEAIRTGMGPHLTASHTTAFGSYDNAYAFKLMGFLAKANINFVANPLINITLQGRYDTYPKRRGITRVKELWQAGLNVSLGYDDIMDPWYPPGHRRDAPASPHGRPRLPHDEPQGGYGLLRYGHRERGQDAGVGRLRHRRGTGGGSGSRGRPGQVGCDPAARIVGRKRRSGMLRQGGSP